MSAAEGVTGGIHRGGQWGAGPWPERCALEGIGLEWVGG